MHVLTFANLKGGSAKTTSALAVAAEAARRGLDVVLLDLDPQATLTVSAGVDPGPVTAALLAGECDAAHAYDALRDVADGAPLAPGGRLRILPASRHLLRLERTAPVRLSERVLALAERLESEADLFVVDTPPQTSALVTAGLASADYVVVPVASGRGALDGLLDVIEVSERLGTPPVTGAFVTRVNVSSHHDRNLVDYVADHVGGPDGPALTGFVRETVRVREAEMARIPLPFYAPSCTAATDYANLVDELEPLFAENALSHA